MSISLRAFLVICSILLLIIAVHSIKKGKLRVADSLFWLIFAVLMVLAAIFPMPVYLVASFLGFEAPANFVFLCAILILAIRAFMQDKEISSLNRKLISITQAIALSATNNKVEQQNLPTAQQKPSHDRNPE